MRKRNFGKITRKFQTLTKRHVDLNKLSMTVTYLFKVTYDKMIK